MLEDFEVATVDSASEPEEIVLREEVTTQTEETSHEEKPQNVTEQQPQMEKVEKDTMMHYVFTELREIHKICQNFQAGRIRSAESELEKYHEIDRGRAFDDILRDIARIYVDHEKLPATIEDNALQKKVNNILLDVLQVLESYGVRIQKSEQYSERKLRLTHVVGYEETEDPELHGKIAMSVQTGFCRENLPVMSELVKIYKTAN